MALEVIEQKLAALGFDVTATRDAITDELSVNGPLVVPLEADVRGGERLLMIFDVPTAPDDPIEMYQFRLVYPTQINTAVSEDDDEQDEREDAASELTRVLFMLNRAVVLGHNGLCEETPGLYFSYMLVRAKGEAINDAALEELVQLIDFQTLWQGGILDRVARGVADADSIYAEMLERDLEPQPLFLRRDAA